MNLRRCTTVFPALLLGSPAALASPQLDDAQALVAAGDVLANGWEVNVLRTPALAEDGSWAIVADTTNGGFETNSALLHDGVIVLEEGSTLPSGDVVGNIFGVDLSRDGSIAWSHRLNPGAGGPTVEALYVDGDEALRSGTAISGTGIPAGTLLDDVLDLRYDAPHVLLNARIRPGGGAQAYAMLLVDVTNTQAPTLEMCAYEGQTLPGLSGPITSVQIRGDVASDGTYAFPVRFDDAGTSGGAIVTDGGLFAVEGDAIPGTNWVWDYLNTTYATCAAGGRYAVSASAAEGASIGKGVVYSSSGVVAQENMPIPSLPGTNASFFDGKWLGMSQGGELAFVVPKVGFDDMLIHGGSIALEESTSTVAGNLVSGMSAGFGNRVEVRGDGAEFLVVATVEPNSGYALLLVEPEVGLADASCTTNPNSTGRHGELRGLGGSVALANDLVMEGSDLPPNQFALLLTSQTTGFVANPGGSEGNLCLGGSIGRFNSLVSAADASGVVRMTLDLGVLPQPSVLVGARPGETWTFQLWHRDIVGGAPTSNYTQSRSVLFR